MPVAPGEAWRALLGDGDPTTVAIIRDLRLPRIALGVTVGAGLAASGVVLQATLRNPLAEPYLDTYCPRSGTARSDVLAWLAVSAAARLCEGVPDEEPSLIEMARGE